MMIKNLFIVYCVKLVSVVIKAFHLGTGSTWPGHIALAVNKNFVKEILQNNKVKIILVAGTNGKTTTAKLLRFLLEKNDLKVFQNEEGANLLNGIASSLIKYIDLTGHFDYDVAIFEVDENSLPHVLKQITPFCIILLNLFRDQLDRYGEVNIIADKWQEALHPLPSTTHLVLNADDPQISFLGSKTLTTTHYFSIPSENFTKKDIPHDGDSSYCPRCGNKLLYEGMSYSHLGIYKCSQCTFKRPEVKMNDKKLLYPLRGTYNMYNTNAVVLVASALFDMPILRIQDSLKHFKAAFGRQEEIEYQGRKIIILLSKNPAGFNQSIQVANEFLGQEGNNALVALNDRIPDGHDVSWIWDVEFEELIVDTELFLSGDRVYDLALRIQYAQSKPLTLKHIYENLNEAVNKAVEETEPGKTLVIMATYSAMLEVRELLLGRKLL